MSSQLPFDLYAYSRSAAASATSTSAAAAVISTAISFAFDDNTPDNNGSDDNPAIPLPNQRAFEGPWFSQQLSLSIFIGLFSFFVFVFVRRRNAALFAPRTKLKGFSPLDDGHDSGYFGWIMPTLKTEEMRILQTVGLDAAILLSFLKMGFWLFFLLSCWSVVVLMPVNYWQNGVLDGVSPAEDRDNATDPSSSRDTVTGVWTQLIFDTLKKKPDEQKEPLPQLPLPTKPPQAQLYHGVHLLSTYLFTLLAMRAIWINYQRFVRSRQLYILEILESIPARTVEIRDLPSHLRDEKALAEYFENMDMPVESTAVVRNTEGLSRLLNQRSNALHRLEQTWVGWLGNPTDAEGYDPEKIMLLAAGAHHDDLPSSDVTDDLVRVSVDERRSDDLESSRLLGSNPTSTVFTGADTIRTHRPRPTMRKQWWNPFSEKIDALDELTRQFNAVDRAVRRRRKTGRFREAMSGSSLSSLQPVPRSRLRPCTTPFRLTVPPAWLRSHGISSGATSTCPTMIAGFAKCSSASLSSLSLCSTSHHLSFWLPSCHQARSRSTSRGSTGFSTRMNDFVHWCRTICPR